MPMTKQLNVAIVDSNPALSSGLHIQKEDPPDPRVSTVTPASISFLRASMPMTKQLNVAIVDSNPALSSGLHIKKEDPPDPRVSTVTPASISFLRGIMS
ncbi:ubiquinone biosynthesis monooxygenase Coq6 [Vigna unguiculata]|uniref:Ubiquinone biosynthesis monooxygenase Coq6 n=1 Tax=Vigna unguiculata TaxID=3917 RepID=A0A4D6M3I3_VIGUN|nr:ubiquinone biosynthesis monooxygenase Coq6 [Vigna unguiculata]